MASRNMNQMIELPFLADYFKITKCYFKKHYFNAKNKKHTTKKHFHNFFELHLMEKGHVSYEIQGSIHTVKEGELLIIPPKMLHRLTARSDDVVSYHLTFCFQEIPFDETGNVYLQQVDEQFKTVIHLIEEKLSNANFNAVEVGSLVFSVIASLPVFQDAFGTKTIASNHTDIDRRLELAKQFIKDNVLNNPSVDDVASYCNLSQKQLSRIFQKYEGLSLKKYIISERIEKLEYYISQKDMTAKEIAFAMSFSNEYYFNTFFKKHFGMSPGEYKKISK